MRPTPHHNYTPRLSNAGAAQHAATAGESNWTLGAEPGANIYVHGFGASAAGSFTAMSTTAGALVSGVAKGATSSFYTQIKTPTSITGYGVRNMTVTITAVSP